MTLSRVEWVRAPRKVVSRFAGNCRDGPSGPFRTDESLIALRVSSERSSIAPVPKHFPAMHKNLIPRLLPAVLLGASLLNAGPALEKQADGIVLPLDQGFLKVEVRADNIIRVGVCEGPNPSSRGPAWSSSPRRGPAPAWDLKLPGRARAVVATARLKRPGSTWRRGTVSFLDGAGRPVAAEKTGGPDADARSGPGRANAPRAAAVGRSNSRRVALRPRPETSWGLVDIKGYDLDLWQHNGTVVIPFLVSSGGLWHPVGQSLVHAVRRPAAV
jgi:hypothetical protein